MASARVGGGGGAGRKKIVLTGDREVVTDILHHFDETDEIVKRLLGFHIERMCDPGENLTAEFTDQTAGCDAVVLVFSKCLLEDGPGCVMDLYHVVFAVGKHDKPKCLLLVGVSSWELPLGLQNFPAVKVEKVADLSVKHLLDIEAHLAEMKVAIINLGNIAQGQAFSNFFGYFHIILPGLADMFKEFENSPNFKKLKESKPGYTFRIFNKFVEIVQRSGENVDFNHVDGILTLDQWWGNTEVEKDRKAEIQKIFIKIYERCGVTRSYNVYVNVVYDDVQQQAIVFAGHCAPACNVIHRLTGESGEKDRKCYANTSAKIANHPNNKDCNDKLFVHFGAASAKELFPALHKQLEQPPNQSCVKDRSIDKCLIMHDRPHLEDPAKLEEFDEILTKVQKGLEDNGVQCENVECGKSVVEESNADLVVLLKCEGSQNFDEEQILTEMHVTTDSTWKLLIIETSRKQGKVTLTPFLKEHGKILDGLCVSSDNFEERFREFLENGHRHLLDMMLLDKLYIGLAQAFVINYLKVNINAWKDAKEKGLLPRLYEIVPYDGDVENKDGIEGIEKDGEFHKVVGRRQFASPIHKLDIGKDGKPREVRFFMEYNTACSVFPKIKESKFGAVLNERLLRREVAFFTVELQALISKDEELKDFVRVIPLKKGEKALGKIKEDLLDLLTLESGQ